MNAFHTEADLGIFSMFGGTGAEGPPQIGGPSHQRTSDSSATFYLFSGVSGLFMARCDIKSVLGT